MGSKLSVAPTIRDHFDTFRDDSSGGMHLPDYLIFIGGPAFAAALIAWFDVRLKDVSGVLGGLSVFTALLFGLVIFVFQLRLQLKSDGVNRTGFLMRLVDQLFANVNYAVVVGVVTTTVGVVAINVGDKDAGAPVWLSAILTGLGLHLVLTIFMCVKRVHSAYKQLARP
ncbi:hypothetical protein [Rhodococcus wratislaviensis]|uniref:hypothetical protein n=1 Tax=Rhodococcus wratislaviensis TaxID=44752 RepID=UPI00351127F8